MPAEKSRADAAAPRRYRFVIGVSLTALEQHLNDLVEHEPDLELKQILYAQGSGFVAVVERNAEPPVCDRPPEHTAPRPPKIKRKSGR